MGMFQDNRYCVNRLKWLRAFIVVSFLILIVKLWHLTIIQYPRFQKLAEQNQIRTVPLPAPRGLIVDREGRVLADNIRTHNLLLFREQAVDLESTVDFLVDGLGLDESQLRKRIQSTRDYSMYQPLVVKEDLSVEEMAFLLARQTEHPELQFYDQPRRRYRYGQLASHVLGYVGEVSKSQLESQEFSGNHPGDVVGQYGLERKFNQHLKGVDGVRRILVNNVGKSLEELQRVEARQGEKLELTLDLDLQWAAEEALSDSPGAAVVLDPKTGEVLALASSPSFDPNLFASRISTQAWNELINNPDDPLQNRSLQNTFSPGSIFKVMMVLAGLESKVVSPDSRVYCNGGINLYGNRFRCWKEGGHGWVALRGAIQHSCNVYFYLLGQKLGIEQIASFSNLLGLGKPTGIDLQGEVAGLVPTDSWKRKTTGQPWYPGETISVSIGQGPIEVTPIQLARAIGIVATGENPQMHVVYGAHSNGSSEVRPLPDFDPEHLQAVRDGMWSVVNDWGTGRRAKVADFDVCGKTGTVQTISRAALERLPQEERSNFEPNAWFVGFAPRDNPEIAVAVIIQRGGGGGSAAAPIAGRILETYHEKKRFRLQEGGHHLSMSGGG